MRNIFVTCLFALCLQSCSAWSWFTDKTYSWGESMPVKDGRQRCEDGNFCFDHGKNRQDPNYIPPTYPKSNN